MPLPDFSDTFIAKALVGLAGSVVSLKFIPAASWGERAFMVVCGGLISYYATPGLAKWLGVEESLVGFALGMFGMAIVAKLHEAWQALDVKEVVKLGVEKFRKVMGI